jgi:hypothetical protein
MVGVERSTSRHQVNTTATIPSPLVERCQSHIPDEVLAAGLFMPNAGGRHELSWRGFQRRQLLKGAGCYQGERVVVAVTALQVWTLELGLRDRVISARHWDRDGMLVRHVPTHGAGEDLEWPAFRITSVLALPAIELVIRHRDESAAAVLRLLGLARRT